MPYYLDWDDVAPVDDYLPPKAPAPEVKRYYTLDDVAVEDEDGFEGYKYGPPDQFTRRQAFEGQDHTAASELYKKIYAKDFPYTQKQWDKANYAAKRGREIAQDDRPGGAAAWSWNLPRWIAGLEPEDGISKVDPLYKQFLLDAVQGEMSQRAKRGGPAGMGVAQTAGRGVQESVIDTVRSIPNMLRTLGLMNEDSAKRLETVNEIADLKYGMDPGSYSGEGIVARALDATSKDMMNVGRISGQMLQTMAGSAGLAKLGQVVGGLAAGGMGAEAATVARVGQVAGRAGGLIGGSGQMFALTFPESYDYAKNELKLSEGKSRFFALASASIQSAIEQAQIEGLLSRQLSTAAAKTMKGRAGTALWNFARTVGAETTEEGLQAGVDPLGKEIVDALRGDGFEITPPIEAMVEEMKNSVLSMAVMSAPMAVGGFVGGKRQHAQQQKAMEWFANPDNVNQFNQLIIEGKVGASRKLWENLPQELRDSLQVNGKFLNEGNRRDALNTLSDAYKDSDTFKKNLDDMRKLAQDVLPEPPAVSPEPQVSPPSETPAPSEQAPPAGTPQVPPQVPAGPPQLPGAQPQVLEQGKEYGQKFQADVNQIAERIMAKYEKQAKTPEAKQALRDQAYVIANQLVTEEVAAMRAVEGGTPGKGALLQQTQETVKQVKEITGGKTIGNEKKMFGQSGIMARATTAAKKALGWTKLNVLTKSARAELKTKIQGKKYIDPFAAGSAMDANLDQAGIEKTAARAADEVAEFMAAEGTERFSNYYEDQNIEEDRIASERFPEFAGDTPEAQAMNQFRRGVLNAVASAQTELSKNTGETLQAWEGVRSTGRVPVLFTEPRTVKTKTGEKQVDKPVFQLPKPDASRAEGPLASEVEQIITSLQKLRPSIPTDAMDVLMRRTPVPEGLKKLEGKDKGKDVKTYKDYFYEWAAPTFITGEARRGVFTTSKGLTLKMLVELEHTSPEAFRSRMRTAFEIGGGTSMENKAENYRIIDQLLEANQREVNGRMQPDFEKVVAYLNERVPMDEINAIRARYGFGPYQGKVVNDIIDTVYSAEGQETMIPRTFIFGPKVGAYMLNRMAEANPKNADYNTMDVWESRFWRYIVDEKLSNDSGIASGAERKVFMRLANAFVRQMKDRHGLDMKTSAGQAARWYLEKKKAADAGYGKAGETETIPAWTQRRMGDWRQTQLGVQETGFLGEQLATAFAGEDFATIQAEMAQPVVPKRQAAKLAKQEAKAAAPPKLNKSQKKLLRSIQMGQSLLFGDLDPVIQKPEVLQRQTAAEAVQTIAPTGPTTQITTGEVTAQVETQAEPGQASGPEPGVPARFVRPNGWVNLFRYSRAPRGDSYNIDPSQAQKQAYSRRDYDASNVQRTFFYLDTQHKEAIIGNHLYGAEIESNRIYDLMNDPEGLKEKHKWGPQTDLQEVMQVLKNNGWAGIHYRTGGMELVNMFVPVTGQSIASEGDFRPASETTVETAARPEVAPPTEAPGINDSNVIATLFQKVGGRIVGSMEQILKNGKVQILLRAFKGSDIDTGIEEMAHGLRRLVVTRELTADQRGFSDELLHAIEKRYGVADGIWTVEAEENFARDYRKRLAEGLKGIKTENTKLQKAYNRLGTFLTNFYQNIKRGVLGDQAVSAEMDQLFEQIAERRQRLTRGAPSHVQRSIENMVSTKAQELADNALANGGFTFNTKTGTYPTEGYSVAPSKASEYKINLATTDPKDIPRLIQEFVAQNVQTQARDGFHLGAWISQGHLWLDNALVENDLETAKAIGRANKQEAIWDLKNSVEISLKETPSDQGKQAPDGGPKDTKKVSTKGREKKRAGDKTSGRARLEAEGITLEGQQPSGPGGEADAEQAQEEVRDTGLTVTSTLKGYETQETIDSRMQAQTQGRVDWSPYTGPNGTRPGKAKPPLEVVRDLLERVGISVASYDPSSQPGVAGYYKFTMSMAQKVFSGTGREMYLAASHLANIGTAVHEVAHYLDNMLNISGFHNRLVQIGGLSPAPKGQGLLESADVATQYQFQLLDYHVAQHGQLRQDKVRGMAEGLAEAVRIYCQSPDPSSTLPQDVKTFIDGLVMQHPKVAELMNYTRSQFQAYLNTPAAERVAFAITSPDARNADPTESYYARQDRTGRSKGWWRLFTLKIQNRIRDIETMEKRTKEMFHELWKTSAENVNEAWDRFVRVSGGLPSQFMMLAQGRIAHATDQAVRFGIYDPMTFQRLGNSAASIFANFSGKREIEEFGKYMYAKVALLRWSQAQAEGTDYIVGQIEPAALHQLVTDIEAGPNSQKYQQAMQDVTTYFNTLLQLQVTHGLKTPQEANAIMAKQDIYMPFFRQIPNRVARTAKGTGGKFLGVKSSIRKLRGGSVYPVLDVYNAIVDKTSDMMSEVVRAVGEQNFIQFAERSGVSGDFVRKVRAEEAAGMKGVTTIVRNGVKFHYIIDPDLKDALTQISPQLNPVAAKILSTIGAPVDFAKKFLVTYNIPFFTTKNYLRDIKTTALRGLQDMTGIEGADTTYLTAKAAKRGSVDALKRITGQSDKPSDVDTLFTNMGLERQTRVRTSRSPKWSKQQTRRIFLGAKDRSATNRAGDYWANTLHYLESINDAVELGPRREAFLMTLQLLGQTQGAGFSVDSNGAVTGTVPQWALTRAANNSLEVTTNFNRRGQWQPYLEPVFMFFNAAVQGTAGMGMTGAKVLADIKSGNISKPHAKRFAIAVTIAATAKIGQMAMMAIMHPDDDDEEMSMLDLWAEQADYARAASDIWMFSPRFGISIPREREWGFFYRAVDDAVAQAVRDGVNPWSVHLFAKNMLKPANIWKQTMTEIDQRLPLSGGFIPMGVQLFFNYDMFRGREIDDKWEQGKLPKYRYDERTGSAARWLGTAAQAVADTAGVEALAVSPRQWDFILRQEFGSLPGKLIEDVVAIGAPDKLRRNNLPFVGPFLTDPTARQSIADYYEMRERSGMEFDEWKNDRKELPEATVQRILDNESTVGVTDSVLKLIRTWPDAELSQEAKAKYQTGVTRWALERKALDEYPNPLLQYLSTDMSDSLKIAIVEILKREMKEKPRVDESMKAKPERFRQAVEARVRLRPRLLPKE